MEPGVLDRIGWHVGVEGQQKQGEGPGQKPQGGVRGLQRRG